MKEKEIVQLALKNLEKNIPTCIRGKWQDTANNELNGKIVFTIINQHSQYHVKVMNELRSIHLPKLLSLAKQYHPLLVVALHFFPSIKEELLHNKISYLEANGNAFLLDGNNLLWIDKHKPILTKTKTGNRAFTKTGLKVAFQFFIDENLINKTYRQIAEQTGTTIGNISHIIIGLKQNGYLLAITKNKYKFNNKKDLIHEWAAAYEKRLKPDLKIGSFRFLRAEDLTNWKNLQLKKDRTYWGGEAAGDILTNYLRAAELTLYTTETKNELIKNYRMVPDENGYIKAYTKFWKKGEIKDNLVPPILAYADLINTNDRRCLETGQKIYNEYLQNKI